MQSTTRPGPHSVCLTVVLNAMIAGRPLLRELLGRCADLAPGRPVRWSGSARAWALFVLVTLWSAWRWRRCRRLQDAKEAAKAEPAAEAPAAAAAPAARRRAEGTAPPAPRIDAPVGDRGVGADRALPALPVGLLHRPGDPPVHGAAGSARRCRLRWSRSSRPRSGRRSSRKPTTPAATTSRSWPAWSAPGSPTCPTAGPRPRRR